MPRGYVGKGGGVAGGVIALYFLHAFGIELGQRDVAADGKEADFVGDAVDLFLEQGGAHSNGEGVDLEAAFAGDDEVAPFVNKNGDAEEEEHHKNNINYLNHRVSVSVLGSGGE